MLGQRYSTDMPRPILQIQRTGLGLFFSIVSSSGRCFVSVKTNVDLQ